MIGAILIASAVCTAVAAFLLALIFDLEPPRPHPWLAELPDE